MKSFYLMLGFTIACESAFAGAIEEWVENSPQPEVVQEWLDELREHPLDVNRVSRTELLRLPFFDEMSVERLLDARAEDGNFRRIEDVLRRSEWSAEQREVLQRYTAVIPRPEHARLRATSQVTSVAVSSLRGSFSSGERTSGFVMMRQEGARPQVLQDVSVGIVYSRPEEGWQAAAGDFQFESGTGLVFGSAYGSSSWLARGNTLIPPKVAGLKSKPASDKLSTFRGAALQMTRGMFGVTALISRQRLDAIMANDGVERIAEGESVSTLTEAARDDQVEERLSGAEISAHLNHWRLSVCGARSRFSPEFDPAPDPTQPFAFHGRQLDVGGLSLSGGSHELEFSLETARSIPGGSAARAVIALQRNSLGLSLYHSYASPDFFSLHSKAWGAFGNEAVNANRTGIRLRFASGVCALGLHAWNSLTPFRTASLPLRKTSNGIELRSSLPLTSILNAEILGGQTWNEGSGTESHEVMKRTDRARLDLTLLQDLEFKFRLEARSVLSDDDRDSKRGSLLFLQTKYPNRLATLLLRVTFFDIESGDAAIRAYEAAPMGAFPIVTYSGSGRRAAGMISRRLGVLSAALKFVHTQDDDGSSLEGVAQMSLVW